MGQRQRLGASCPEVDKIGFGEKRREHGLSPAVRF